MIIIGTNNIKRNFLNSQDSLWTDYFWIYKFSNYLLSGCTQFSRTFAGIIYYLKRFGFYHFITVLVFLMILKSGIFHFSEIQNGTTVNYLYIMTIWNNMIGHEITLKKYSIILPFILILPRVAKIKIIVFSACKKSI